MSFHQDEFHQRSKLSDAKLKSIERNAMVVGQLSDKLIEETNQDEINYGELQKLIVLIGRGTDLMMKELTGRSLKIAL